MTIQKMNEEEILVSLVNSDLFKNMNKEEISVF